MKLKSFIKFFLVLLIGIGIGVYVNAKRKTKSSKEPPLVADAPRQNPYSGMTNFIYSAEKSIDAVVHIRVSSLRYKKTYPNSFFDFFFNDRARPEVQVGFGSGVIVGSSGYIVTNNHVIEHANEIDVILNDKRTFRAQLVGQDPSTDLAVIKIEGSDFKTLKFGDSDSAKIGEWVLAVGNPFNLSSTVTAGIVSAKARNIDLLRDIGGIESFIQTDAVINQGNSGGALVNMRGQLIGINTAIHSQNGSYNGYSFAVPSNIAQKVYNDIREFGRVQRALIGVSITENSTYIANQLGLKTLKGVFVQGVAKGSAASNAGLRSGDIILKIGTKETNSIAELQEVISQYSPGDKVVVEAQRGENLKTFTLHLTDYKSN